jgi:hypothetical protein
MDLFALACAAFLPLADGGRLLPEPVAVQVRMLFLKPGMTRDQVEKVLLLENRFGFPEFGTTRWYAVSYQLTRAITHRSGAKAGGTGVPPKPDYILLAIYSSGNKRDVFSSATLLRGGDVVAEVPKVNPADLKMFSDLGSSSFGGSPYGPFPGPGFRVGPLPRKPLDRPKPCKD